MYMDYIDYVVHWVCIVYKSSLACIIYIKCTLLDKVYFSHCTYIGNILGICGMHLGIHHQQLNIQDQIHMKCTYIWVTLDYTWST